MIRLVITGASGAVGLEFVSNALRAWPDAELICLVRSHQARAAILTVAGEDAARLRFVFADLTDDDSMTGAATELGDIGRVIGLHAAADVSWEHRAEDMTNLNVGGTLRFASFLQAVSSDPAMVYLSTAYTQPNNWHYRNGYELTKAQAERCLEKIGQDMPVSIFAISLVVGNSRTGRISRHNGIYPIFKALAEYGPPFLVGNKDTEIDIVPVDWICDELLRFIEARAQTRTASFAIAAAGPGRRITFGAIVRNAEHELVRFDIAHGLEPDEPLPLIRTRQWDFLMRCSKAWKITNGISVQDFRSFERLLKTYATYCELASVREPENIVRSAPEPESYLHIVFARWLEENGDRVFHRRSKRKSMEADNRTSKITKMRENI